ncbi:MAG: beta-ketoacyl synthase N-terminal-like domain-containing protein [Candidatus Poseidoniaceae archaeon]
MTITTADGKEVGGTDQGPFEPIAIIGCSALMPDAEDATTFWQNIIDSRVSIRDLPEGRWPGPIDQFWAEGSPGQVEQNRTYAKIGAFVEGFEFDWRRWRQPPGTLAQIDPCQLWAVEVAASALEHAGYGDEGRPLDRSRVGVVFANALGGENRNESNQRVWAERNRALAIEAGLPASSSDAFVDAMVEGAPKITEDTMPGELANVVSGRVANLLDLQGPNHAMDAACASSLAALLDACRLLHARQVDAMICGASDRTMDPATYAKFSAIGALSPSHSTPFDARANGFVMGEGAGALVLKRLSDAVRDGDEVFAVIRGIGGSSDGRGKGITAPSQRGQIQAIARAYNQAGYAPSSVELVEAHGTSTKVGDATELSTLGRLWTDIEAGDNVAVGSIKSQIGHLKAAAGMAGLLKVTMALHHATIPPSAGFETPNPTVDWSTNPFFVPTEPMAWPRPEGHPRRAGVSAFGFGGTNFHVALEAYDPEVHTGMADEWSSRWSAYASAPDAPAAPSILDSTATPSLDHAALKSVEGGLLLLSGESVEAVSSRLATLAVDGPTFDDDPRGHRLSAVFPQWSTDFDANAAVRLAVVATSWAEFEKRKGLAVSSLSDPARWGFLAAQGVMITDQPAMPPQAKVAHMYPGQGSQYVGMTHDLWQRYSSVQEVWRLADETMVEVLDGETLSSFVLRSNLSKEEIKDAEAKLKRTEYTQPAMLTADLAIERALNDHGLKPDMVAGHSLGEYAALMSAGIMDMDSALRAAAARGTEMGSVEIDDQGLMASVSAPLADVERILEATDGYVISANKNSPKMTVIAGETAPVKAAMAAFEAESMPCTVLQTSHAFHSKIVAPANAPLRAFLEELDLQWPTIPITANVDGTFYAMEGDNAKAAVLEKLAPQMASSVEWTAQIETMAAAGAGAFVEVGPKRALTVFATQILEGKPHLAVMTNHPKQGGIASFLSAMGMLALAGRVAAVPDGASSVLTEAFRAGPVEAWASTPLRPVRSSEEHEDLRTRARPLPSNGGAPAAAHAVAAPTATVAPSDPAEAIAAYVGDRLAAVCGYPARFCRGAVDLRLGLGLDDAKVASVVQRLRAEASLDGDVDIAAARTPAELVRAVRAPPSGWSPAAPATRRPVQAVAGTAMVHDPMAHRRADPYVITGVSLGLPGGERVFDEDVFERLVRGETCIEEVTDAYKQALLDRNIVRLVKGRDGSVDMSPAETFGDIPQLAGVAHAFDLAEEFGVDPKAVLAWDITTQLAVASGLLALRDAAIPLTPEEQVGKGGLRLIRGWQVPQHQRERTGVVFASCFPGTTASFEHARNNGADAEGRFDRRFLFQVLNMGHAQFAQYTGIRGPNSTINVACASATAAFSIAEDWLANDRADRVVIISSDNVTSPELWSWIGAGFAASGAASSSNVIEEAALPFDRRRNGLILGMGAAAFVVERNAEAAERGVQPYAELLGTRMANSAFHGTRLDVDHVAQTVDGFVGQMEHTWGLDRHTMAPNTVFFSHETYTPARGGSAQSEVKALRTTFGESTDKILIANTKGFTGHPMGVGIEDASMIHGLHHRRFPPIANHKEVDPELGNLNLSKGGSIDGIEYGIRFGAGFGSQIALSLVRRWPVEGDRIDGRAVLAWNRRLAGTNDVVLRVLDNKLVAYVDGESNLHGGVQGEAWGPSAPFEGLVDEPEAPPVPAPEPVAPAAPAPTVAPPVAMNASNEEVASAMIEVVVEHTGYPAEFIEMDQDLEGELGIDTVKQAEIMAALRDRFSLPVDEDFVLSDHPTLNHMLAYLTRMQGGAPAPADDAPPEAPSAPASPAEAAPAEPEPAALEAPVAPAPVPASDAGDLVETVVAVVVEHTGYPADFIEMDQDLEGELGIDTVKQAEIMADIRARFSLPIDEDFLLSDHPTLNHMVDYIQRMTGGGSEPSTTAPSPSPAPAAQPAPAPAPTPAPPAVAPASNDDGSISARLVEVVVKHTGYPEDFIELDQDLEGELGIDTVKQAEIMAEVRAIFDLPVDEDFLLSDHPTLNHFVAYVAKYSSSVSDGSGAASTPSAAVEAPQAAPAPSQTLSLGNRRWQVEIEPCPGDAAPLNLSGRVLVTEDDWGISAAVAHALSAKGFDVVHIGLEPGAKSHRIQEEGDRIVHRVDPASSEQMDAFVEALGDAPLAGLIHLAPLRLASMAWSEESGPSQQVILSGQAWFGLLKSLDARLGALDAGLVASVSAMDGRHGNRGDRFNALQAAAAGVTKSYAHERPSLRCRAYDVHPDMLLDAETTAERLVDDLLNIGGEVEIGLDRAGERWTLVCFAEDLVEEQKPLMETDVWLVSGGGSGVTAAAVIGVAAASKDAGASFHLLGRTPLMEVTEAWLDHDDSALEAEKMALRERMIEASSSGKVTMVEWNRAWDRMMRSRDVQRTLARIQDTGNLAQYHAVDVMDAKALTKLGASLGHAITGVVHGAGLEESKLVADKTHDAFDRVVRVKVDGWTALMGAVEASGARYPAFAACFTSVAGRFGNGGQTDYAAANSVLDAEMSRLTASGACRAVAIGWTGWRDVGMATRGSIEAVFEAAGIETLPVEVGVELFVGEALAGGKRRVLGCGSLGAMDTFAAFREAPLKLPPGMAGLIADPQRFPFIDKVVAFDEDARIVTQTTLSIDVHPFLVDHAIDGVPYHPGVMALEMFAQNALLLKPGTALAGFKDVTFGLPVKIMREAMTVRVEATLSHASGGAVDIQCRLVSDLVSSSGEVFGEREHHTAVVRLVEQAEDLSAFFAGEVASMPETGLAPAPGDLLHHPSFIYLRYFHGPRFQSHGGVLRGVQQGDNIGVDGLALMRHQLPAKDQFAIESEGESVLLEALPMLIEAGFQNAGLVAMESEGLSSLPVGIEWSTMLRVPDEGESLRMRSLCTGKEDGGITVHDVVIFGEEDDPVLAMRGLRLKGMAPVPEDLAVSIDR